MMSHQNGGEIIPQQIDNVRQFGLDNCKTFFAGLGTAGKVDNNGIFPRARDSATEDRMRIRLLGNGSHHSMSLPV